MTALTVIFSEHELDYAPPGELNLALDPDAWTMLTQAGHPTITTDDLPGYNRSVRDNAASALDAWRQHARSMHDGVNIFDLVAYRHVRWITRLTAVITAVSSALEYTGATGVRLLEHPGGHALDIPSDQSRMTALHASAMAAATRRGLPTTIDPAPVTPPADIPAHPHDPAASADVPEVHALFIADGPEIPRSFGIARALQRATGLDHTLVSHTDPGPATLTIEQYAGPINMKFSGDPSDALAAFQSMVSALDTVTSTLFTASELGDHHRFLFGAYANTVGANHTRWTVALEHHRPEVVVGSYPSIPLEAASRLGIPTILIPHGIMLTGADHYADRLHPRTMIGAAGSTHQERLIVRGVEPNRIRITGVVTPASATAVTRSCATPTLLIPTTETTRPAHLGEPPCTSFTKEAQVIERLAIAMSDAGWDVRLRPHPRYDRERRFYENIAARVRSDRFSLCDPHTGTFQESVQQATAVAFVGAPTSAIAEAALFGRPVLLITEALDAGTLERWGLTAFEHAESVPAAANALESMRRDTPRWTQHAQRAAHGLAAQDALERTVAILTEMLAQPSTTATPS